MTNEENIERTVFDDELDDEIVICGVCGLYIDDCGCDEEEEDDSD